GGPRILDDLSRFLGVDGVRFAYSRATLESYGNIASAVVLDALRRIFDDGGPRHGWKGLIAGFGPGITAETCAATWVGGQPEAGRAVNVAAPAGPRRQSEPPRGARRRTAPTCAGSCG